MSTTAPPLPPEDVRDTADFHALFLQLGVIWLQWAAEQIGEAYPADIWPEKPSADARDRGTLFLRGVRFTCGRLQEMANEAASDEYLLRNPRTEAAS